MLESERLTGNRKGFSLIVNLIVLGKNDPKGPILPVRLFTKNLTNATIEGR
jgi:hypothetical protein